MHFFKITYASRWDAPELSIPNLSNGFVNVVFINFYKKCNKINNNNNLEYDLIIKWEHFSEIIAFVWDITVQEKQYIPYIRNWILRAWSFCSFLQLPFLAHLKGHNFWTAQPILWFDDILAFHFLAWSPYIQDIMCYSAIRQDVTFPEAQPKGIYIVSRECHIIYPVW